MARTAPIYLDNNAPTPLAPGVREAMLPWIGERFGNASSVHSFGQAARNAIEEARERVAALLGARPPEIVFTASGTEASTAVLFDMARRARGMGHLAVSAFEHPSVREGAARLEASGLAVSRIAPGRDGVVPAAAFAAALRPDTHLACLLLANNEVGTLQPVAELAASCRSQGVLLLCDAVQAVGKIPVDVQALGVDFLVLGAHKFGGPLGAAALWIRPGTPFEGLLAGGSQERRRRAGTENVAAIVGFGEAAARAAADLAAGDRRGTHLAALRDAFEAGLASRLPEATVHCATSPRLPNTSHLDIPGVEGESLLIRLDLAGFAVSTGSACSSGTVAPSKALLAAGFTAAEALSSIRITFGMSNHPDDVPAFLDALVREAAALRQAAPAALAR